MNEEKFWEIVDFIDWKELCKIRKLNVNSVVTRVARQYPFEVIQEFREVCREKKNQVAILTREQGEKGAAVPTGGDSFGDLCAHVVGMGKEYFEDIVANPDKIASVPYEECFSYCIPFRDAYEKLESGYFKKVAAELKEHIVDVYRKDPILSKLGEKIDKIEEIIVIADRGEFDKLPDMADCEIAFESLKIKLKSCQGTFAELDIANGLVKKDYWYFVNSIIAIRALSSEFYPTL